MKTLLLTTIITLGLATTTANASMDSNIENWNMDPEEYQEPEKTYTLKVVTAANETHLDGVLNEAFQTLIQDEDADFQ